MLVSLYLPRNPEAALCLTGAAEEGWVEGGKDGGERLVSGEEQNSVRERREKQGLELDGGGGDGYT